MIGQEDLTEGARNQNPKPEFNRCTSLFDEFFLKKNEKVKKSGILGFEKCEKVGNTVRKKKNPAHGTHTDDTEWVSWL